MLLTSVEVWPNSGNHGMRKRKVVAAVMLLIQLLGCGVEKEGWQHLSSLSSCWDWEGGESSSLGVGKEEQR